ncbi:ABC transporter permease subunit [Cohnella phaseoli]|uniref:Putative aldouronate transport system permease protein n=1 Tax=Cohnella phaseoli TaxID=456490 RepID=A0A3D9IUS4_9BACL|nr:ABC transporter permease subunit [Cohnella phaseoli]RED65484.1 putative aldouronate transport system permease protein [Cohnella phaseoli]
MGNTIVPARGRKVMATFVKQRYLFLMLLPAFVLVFLFSYIPLSGWIIAFVNYRPGSDYSSLQWMGLQQFTNFFAKSSDYIYLLRNTLAMNIGSLITNLVTAFIFALLMNEIRIRFFGKLIQTITFFPFFISWVIIYSFSSALFATSAGAINETLVGWGIVEEGFNFLGDPKYAWVFMIALGAWKYLGYNSVIFISSIASISNEYYEAAQIDGANRFQRVWYITIPGMIPTLIVLLILNSGWILNSNFEQFYLFTNPTNWEKMEVLDIYIYKYGLQLLNFPYATAVGIMKTFVSLILIVAVNAISKKATDKAIF